MSDHQKRISAPKTYPIERKDGSYVVKAEGPHRQDAGLPVAVLLRDVLGEAESMSEVTQAMSAGKVLVNGKPRANPRSTVGFMDIVSFPGIDTHYRVLVGKTGFRLVEVDADEASRKLVRVDDKTTLPDGVTQLNLSDGNNIEVDDTDIGTKGSVLVSLPDLEIEDEVPYEEGALVYVRGGKHVGELASIVSIDVQPGSQENTVTLESEDNGEFETVERNVYVVGDDEPVVDIDE